MTEILQIGHRTITSNEIIPLLASYQLLPQFLREVIIDQAISSISCSNEEKALACQQFYQQNQLTSEAECQTWLQDRGIALNQLDAIVTRLLRVEKFKQAAWGHQLESYFLQRKSQLDKVIYSLIRTQDLGVAQELYFRIREQEQSFTELARKYSQGTEAETGGLIGPVEQNQLSRPVAQLLFASQPGQLMPPIRLGEWIVILRLEKFIPAQLDAAMSQRLLNELFTNWLSEQMNQISYVERDEYDNRIPQQRSSLQSAIARCSSEIGNSISSSALPNGSGYSS